LLNLVAGLITHRDGKIVFAGDPVVGPSRRRTLVPQETSLLPWRTIAGNISLVLAASGLTRTEAREVARRSLEDVHLAEWCDTYPHQLSGGMRQRVSLVRALAVRPDLVLLDEPFASLDPSARSRMHVHLGRALGRDHRSALMVTHDIDEALALADQVVVLSPRPATILGRLTLDREIDSAVTAGHRQQIAEWLGLTSLGAARAARQNADDRGDWNRSE
jgi:NitT/TauT family transport system ATP-binding protein